MIVKSLVLQYNRSQISYHESAFICVYLRFFIFIYFMIAPKPNFFIVSFNPAGFEPLPRRPCMNSIFVPIIDNSSVPLILMLSIHLLRIKVARAGFEPTSQGPEPRMIDRYTTGLRGVNNSFLRINLSEMPEFRLDFFYFIYPFSYPGARHCFFPFGFLSQEHFEHRCN